MKYGHLIRLAGPDDCQAIQLIYSYYVSHTVITFEFEVPTVDEITKRMLLIQQKYPYFIYEILGEVVGYAYANMFRSKSAYNWSVETTIYMAHEKTGLGIGKVLYKTLLDCLRLQGYYTAVAGIALPNEASLKLHRSLGFDMIGDYKNIGYKHGGWQTTRWFELGLNSYDSPPAEPLTITKLTHDPRFTTWMANMNISLRSV